MERTLEQVEKEIEELKEDTARRLEDLKEGESAEIADKLCALIMESLKLKRSV